jgi:hypothetical protein
MAARRPMDGACVPVVHRFAPYRFYFWSHENRSTGEPPHIHVQSGNGTAVFGLDPVRRREYWGYNSHELERIRRLIVSHREELLRQWYDFFRD